MSTFNLKYNTRFQFDNSREPIKTGFTLRFSEPFIFSNSGSSITKGISIRYSVMYSFNNDGLDLPRIGTLNYSYGIFPFQQYYDYPYNEYLFYDDFEARIVDKDTRIGYMFDNDVPVIYNPFQIKIKAWSYKDSNIQIAINMPSYALNSEVNIDKVTNQYNLNSETVFYPKIDESYSLNTEFYQPIAKDRYYLNYEFDQPTISTTEDLNSEIFIEQSVPKGYLDIEYMIELTLNYFLGAETDIRWNYYLDAEVDIPYLNKIYDLHAEALLYRTEDFNLNTEYKVIKIDSWDFNTEYNIPNLSKNYTLNTETYVYEITQPQSIDAQFSMVYHTPEDIQCEYNIDKITQSESFNSEVLLRTYTDFNLNVEFVKPFQLNVNYQLKVIPLKVNEELFQVFTRARSYHQLNAEIDVDYITAAERLNAEYKKITELITNFNSEFFAEIESNTHINTETDITTIGNFDLNAEAAIGIKIHELINAEVFANFSAKERVEIEYFIEAISKSNLLNAEYFTDIDTEMELVAEAFVETVSKSLNIEFDVLDLVYYFLRHGYNIIPWLYAEGKGYFEALNNDNWEKSEDSTTALNGLFNQLQELSIQKPDCVQVSDRNFDNFGAIVDGNFENSNLGDRFVYFENVTDNSAAPEQDKLIVLGKKNIKEQTELSTGNHIYIYEGRYDSANIMMFNEFVLPYLNNPDCIMAWDPLQGKWNNIKNSDHALYFEYSTDSGTHLIPYIFTFTCDTSTIINK